MNQKRPSVSCQQVREVTNNKMVCRNCLPNYIFLGYRCREHPQLGQYLVVHSPQKIKLKSTRVCLNHTFSFPFVWCGKFGESKFTLSIYISIMNNSVFINGELNGGIAEMVQQQAFNLQTWVRIPLPSPILSLFNTIDVESGVDVIRAHKSQY